MNQLENALAYATKRGFYLFPCIWNKTHKPLIKWKLQSSKDPETIRSWSEPSQLHPTLFNRLYYCVALQQSKLIVLDIDSKNNKQGFDTLKDLESIYGDLPLTLEVQTPSGGAHLYFTGEDIKTGTNRLGPGIDIPGMVPLPDSFVPDKGEYKLMNSSSEAPISTWVKDIAGPPMTRTEQASSLSPGAPSDQQNINRAIEYLESADPAIEGQGGNDQAYKVVCAVRDFGISEERCAQLIFQYYNERCEPPWGAKELTGIINNAFQYALLPPGNISPEVEFDILVDGNTKRSFTDPTTNNLIPIKPLIKFTGEITMAKWLIKDYFEMESIILLYGETGTYKSFLALDIGLHIATGKEKWAGQKVTQGPVYYIAGEGRVGLSKRLKAWTTHHKEERDVPFYIVPSIPIIKKVEMNRLIKSIKDNMEKRNDPPPVAIFIDTLATTFGDGDENSTKDMNTYLNHINRGLKGVFGCSVFIVHHTGHLAKERPRGAYTLMAGVDSYFSIESPEKGLICLRSPGKMKEGEPSKDTWSKTSSIKVGIDEDLDNITSLVLESMLEYTEPTKIGILGNNQEILLTIVNEFRSITMDDANNEFKAVKKERDEKYNRQGFTAAIKSLIFKRLVKQSGKILECLGELGELGELEIEGF